MGCVSTNFRMHWISWLAVLCTVDQYRWKWYIGNVMLYLFLCIPGLFCSSLTLQSPTHWCCHCPVLKMKEDLPWTTQIFLGSKAMHWLEQITLYNVNCFYWKHILSLDNVLNIGRLQQSKGINLQCIKYNERLVFWNLEIMHTIINLMCYSDYTLYTIRNYNMSWATTKLRKWSIYPITDHFKLRFLLTTLRSLRLLLSVLLGAV